MNVDHRKFLRIADAIACVDQRVNLVGVAIEASIPKSTKGSDYFCSVRIVDESLPNGIRVHFFAETMENLPLMEYAGNILVITQVLIKTWNDDVFAQFNKKYSTFALFDEGICPSTNELVPYQISPNYTPGYQYMNFVTRLMKWSFVDKMEALHALNEPLLLRNIKVGEHQNLLCKILHVAQVKEDEWMLFIWDGTDAPPVSIEAKLEDEMENPLPLVLEPSPLSRDILCTFPTVGTVLRMTVDEGHEKLGIKFVKANRWVKFIDVRCEAHVALWRAVLTPFSKLCYLRDNDNKVMRRQRSHEKRIQSRLERMPFTSLPWPSHITETDHPNAPFITLMDILTFQQVTYKFKCIARVVAMLPWRAVDFHSHSGIFRVRVTLEDPTARIHAYLYKEDGVKFFGNCHSADELTRKRNLLLGVTCEDGTRNPPWIQCCLISYYVKKSDIWGSRNYRIFETKFVG